MYTIRSGDAIAHRGRDVFLYPEVSDMLCRHCDRRPAARPRGLCWSCYYLPGVRHLYPSMSKFGRRGLGFAAERPLPGTPTAAPPGSPEKIEVLMERAARGSELWHPHDASFATPLRLVARAA